MPPFPMLHQLFTGTITYIPLDLFLLELGVSLLGNSDGSSLSGSLVSQSSSIGLVLKGTLSGSLGLSLDDVLNQSTLVLESVTLGRLVQGVVQVRVDLTGGSVLDQQLSQDTQSSHPDNLGGHTRISGTLSLTEPGVTATTLGLSQGSGVRSGVNSNWLLDDGTVSDQSSDGSTRVSLGQLNGLVRVKPNLSLTGADDGSGESLLGAEVSPGG